MSINRRSCWYVTCDVCGRSLADEDSELHFETFQEALRNAWSLRWPIADSNFLVCPHADPQHAAALDALLPHSLRPVRAGAERPRTEGKHL